MSYFQEVKIQGSGGYFYQDKATSAIPTIEYSHHEIHDGDYFHVGSAFALQNNETHNKWISTPNTTKWLHLFMDINSSAEGQVTLWESGTYSGAAALAITPINHNRNSATTSAASLKKNVVVSGAVGVQSSGLLLYNSRFGTGRSTAGTGRNQNEFVLKSGTQYLIEITSYANSNNVTAILDWYEHIDNTAQF